ncbi:HAMP domain-containing histidine kinase [Candidatus Bathyarchaeota archaeon]|nr:HAMP domain-containing histidine kinase [Candidatus Bathyarchaeota archaeon]
MSELRDEKKYISEEMQEIERLVIDKMGHISSELAHDLRSPLQTIQNAVYLIQKNPDNEMLYDMVRQSLKQTTGILDSFRDYYKGHIINPMETEAGKIADLALSNSEIPDNITVIRDYDDSLLIHIDPSKTALAIQKLVINAVEAMEKGGDLRIILSSTPDSVDIRVEDSGAGIPPEAEKVLFDPFVASNKQGNGLGIPTAKRIVESHGGSLSYTTKQGEGTTFTLSFPKPSVDT